MATLKPFRALRPQPAKAPEVCSPPYDVMDTAEARAMAEGNPNCFLRVTRAEIEFPKGVDAYTNEIYEHGARNLQKLIEKGILFQDKKPCFYLYRLTMGKHAQTGLVAVASCADYDANIIKKHELTRPDKEDDRMRHIRILGAQTGPVFLTYKANPEIDLLLSSQTTRQPDVDFTASDGIRHQAWVVADESTVSWIEEAFSGVPALYVCDGHHRSAAASRVAKWRTAGDPNHSGDEPYNYFLSVTFPHNQLRILGYNRVVRDLNGLTKDELLAKLGEVATVSASPVDREPTRKGDVIMYLDRAWRLLRWKDHVAKWGKSEVERLDCSILQNWVLAPIFGIGDPRTDKRISFVGGIRGAGELERLVKGGDFAVAFSMHPTSIDELIAIADEGSMMPPKSTWFEPKLRDAMMTHMI